MRVERSITIRRSPADVFAFVTNVENAVKWQSSTVESRLTSPGPMGPGATIRHVGRFLGRRIENVVEVYEFTPHRAFAYRTLKGVPVDIRYRCDPDERGTKFTLVYGGDGGSLLKIAEPLLEAATARLLEGDLIRLKRVLESQ